jgi:DNA-binding response OmpR family regulator
MRALLVEDNYDLSESLYDYLQSHHVIVDCAYTAQSALSMLEQLSFDVIVLDINLPDFSGFELCQRLRNEQQIITPIIMLTARSSLEDKLSGFDSGAEDYLVKPFEMAELLARMKVLVERQQPKKRILQVGNLIYNLDTQKISRDEKNIELNSSCRKILKLLMKKSPNVVSKNDLEYTLWGDDIPEKEVLKIHIHTLRQKIDKAFNTEYLQTIRGSGYALKN